MSEGKLHVFIRLRNYLSLRLTVLNLLYIECGPEYMRVIDLPMHCRVVDCRIIVIGDMNVYVPRGLSLLWQTRVQGEMILIYTDR